MLRHTVAIEQLFEYIKYRRFEYIGQVRWGLRSAVETLLRRTHMHRDFYNSTAVQQYTVLLYRAPVIFCTIVSNELV